MQNLNPGTWAPLSYIKLYCLYVSHFLSYPGSGMLWKLPEALRLGTVHERRQLTERGWVQGKLESSSRFKFCLEKAAHGLAALLL